MCKDSIKILTIITKDILFENRFRVFILIFWTGWKDKILTMSRIKIFLFFVVFVVWFGTMEAT